MSTKHHDPVKAERQKQARQQMDALIRKQVIAALGQPDESYSVQVRRLSEHCYRVNVVRGLGTSAPRIANSYFLVTDGAGNILTATPPIAKPCASSSG
jgi:hypothetical protein